MNSITMLLKRTFDIATSFFALFFLLPLIAIISFIIKVDSSGPVLFKQERLGKNGNVFLIYKFRTMITQAEFIGDGLTVKSDRVPRITKSGYYLRKFSLDELPQLINVLIGNMSLIGPRPPVTYHPYQGFDNYPSSAKKRFEVKPGITGLAQVKYRNSASWDVRIMEDCFYIDNYSFILDFKIILLTLKRWLNTRNIY